MPKLILAFAVLVVAAAIAVLLQAHHAMDQLRADNDSLQQQLIQLQTANGSLSNQLVAAANNRRSSTELTELLKLRGDVRLLQQQAGEVDRLRAEVQRLQNARPDPQSGAAQASAEALERQQQAAMASLNYARQGVLAFIMYADENQQQFPPSFEQAAPFFKDGLAPIQMNFEIVYIGSITNITNAPDTIVLREKHPSQTLDGKWHKTYGFADGHSEVHTEPDGNFAPWESQRIVPPPANQWPARASN